MGDCLNRFLAFTILVATYLTFHLNRASAVQRLVGERTAELRSANAALRESEAHTRTVVETAADGIVTLDERGIIEAYNPASEAIFGHTAADAIGRPLSFLMPFLADVLDADTSNGRAAERLLAIAGDRRETSGRHKNGEHFSVELTFNALTLDAGAKFTGWMRDITDRKQVERLKSEFISTVSHELRTPLTSINASLGLVADGITGDVGPESAELIEIARNNADRLVRLINDRAYPSDPGLTTCWVSGCHRRNVRLMFCHAQPLEVRSPDVSRRLRGALSR